MYETNLALSFIFWISLLDPCLTESSIKSPLSVRLSDRPPVRLPVRPVRDFLPADKRECFRQVGSITLGLHFQACPKYAK